jgi:hypothetical protein
MAYNSLELRMITGAGGHAGQTWRYEGTDTPAAVAAAGFISDAFDRGMKIGDYVEVVQFSNTAKAAVVANATYVAGAVASTGATLSAGGVGTVTAAAGAATLSALRGKVTTESLTTAAGAEYTLTLTNSQIAAGDLVFVTTDALTSAGTPGVGGATVTAGQVVITITNLHASAAFNAAILIGFHVVKA